MFKYTIQKICFFYAFFVVTFIKKIIHDNYNEEIGMKYKLVVSGIILIYYIVNAMNFDGGYQFSNFSMGNKIFLLQAHLINI